eukprot:m51a1_g10311 hypothetical protein (735) ;mRNA; r:88417-91021
MQTACALLALVLRCAALVVSVQMMDTPPLAIPDGSALFEFAGSYWALGAGGGGEAAGAVLVEIPRQRSRSPRAWVRANTSLPEGAAWTDPAATWAAVSASSVLASWSLRGAASLVLFAPAEPRARVVGSGQLLLRQQLGPLPRDSVLWVSGAAASGLYAVPSEDSANLSAIATGSDWLLSCPDSVVHEGRVLLAVSEAGAPGRLWWSNQTHAGPIDPSSGASGCDPCGFVAFDGDVYYSALPNATGPKALWRLRGGSAAGSAAPDARALPLRTGDLSAVALDAALVFAADSESQGPALYALARGGQGGPVLLAALGDRPAAPGLRRAHADGSPAVAVLAAPARNGTALRLWISDGSPAGTRAVGGSYCLGNATALAAWGGALVFAAADCANASDWGLWWVDPATSSEAEALRGVRGARPVALAALDGALAVAVDRGDGSSSLYALAVCNVSAGCLACSAGDAGACALCPAGQSLEGPGCQRCPNGTFSPGDLARCRDCELAGNCTACSSATGECTACPRGSRPRGSGCAWAPLPPDRRGANRALWVFFACLGGSAWSLALVFGCARTVRAKRESEKTESELNSSSAAEARESLEAGTASDATAVLMVPVGDGTDTGEGSAREQAAERGGEACAEPPVAAEPQHQVQIADNSRDQSEPAQQQQQQQQAEPPAQEVPAQPEALAERGSGSASEAAAPQEDSEQGQKPEQQLGGKEPDQARARALLLAPRPLPRLPQ